MINIFSFIGYITLTDLIKTNNNHKLFNPSNKSKPKQIVHKSKQRQEKPPSQNNHNKHNRLFLNNLLIIK